MATVTNFVPENPARPGYDMLGVGLDARGHFIQEVLAGSDVPLTTAEIGERARALATDRGIPFTSRTFDPDVTGNHLRQYLRDKMGYAEQLPDKRWRLTDRARERIAVASAGNPPVLGAAPTPDVRMVDAKSRVLLPTEFANTTVTVERVSENELRVRKAVVVPVDEFPLIEDQLKPLSDRDRDSFLALLDHPPEPTPALLAAVAEHKRRHG